MNIMAPRWISIRLGPLNWGFKAGLEESGRMFVLADEPFDDFPV